MEHTPKTEKKFSINFWEYLYDMKLLISEEQLNRLKYNLTENEDDIDYILDKWNESGKDSLTPYEKNYLTKKTDPVREGVNYLISKYKDLTLTVRLVFIEPHYDDIFKNNTKGELIFERIIRKDEFVLACVFKDQMEINDKLKEELINYFGFSQDTHEKAKQWVEKEIRKQNQKYINDIKMSNPHLSDDEVNELAMGAIISDIYSGELTAIAEKDYPGYDNKFNINQDQIDDMLYNFILFTDIDFSFWGYESDSNGNRIKKIVDDSAQEIEYMSNDTAIHRLRTRYENTPHWSVKAAKSYRISDIE